MQANECQLLARRASTAIHQDLGAIPSITDRLNTKIEKYCTLDIAVHVHLASRGRVDSAVPLATTGCRDAPKSVRRGVSGPESTLCENNRQIKPF